MERFLTYIIVPLAMGCVFFVFMTRQRPIEGEQSLIVQNDDEQVFVQKNEGLSQTIIPHDDLVQNVPLSRMSERTILKSYGMFISPQNSPIAPERFYGYHTGVDVEIFEDEINMDVPVRAICDGELFSVDYVRGYGGLVVQRCSHDNVMVRILYGHLQLSSITVKKGDHLMQGDHIGILGDAYTSETDGERKHLHIGVYAHDARDVRGYVRTTQELEHWHDPCTIIVCAK